MLHQDVAKGARLACLLCLAILVRNIWGRHHLSLQNHVGHFGTCVTVDDETVQPLKADLSVGSAINADKFHLNTDASVDVYYGELLDI